MLLWRPGSGRGRGSLGRTSKGAKGRVAYRQRIASLARLTRRAIPSEAPSRRWRLGRLGERTSAIAGRAGLRPFVVCPVFRGWRQEQLRHRCAGRERESRTAPVRLRAASFINAACSSSRTFSLHYWIHQQTLSIQIIPTHTTSLQPIPPQQPPQCLSPDRESHTACFASVATREGGVHRTTTAQQANTTPATLSRSSAPSCSLLSESSLSVAAALTSSSTCS